MGTLGGKIGCAAATLAGLPLFAFLWFISFYGSCGEVEACHSGEGARALLIFLATAAIAVAVGLATRMLVNRLAQRNSGD